VRVTDKLSHDGRPRQALLLPVAGSVLALGMGIFLAVSLESVLWLILVVASVIANAGLTVLRRWRLGRSRLGSATGRTLLPPAELALTPLRVLRRVSRSDLLARRSRSAVSVSHMGSMGKRRRWPETLWTLRGPQTQAMATDRDQVVGPSPRLGGCDG
jgi:hypothetical protein